MTTSTLHNADNKGAGYALPALGAALLACGTYFGFIADSNHTLVFCFLGASMLSFAGAAGTLLKRHQVQTIATVKDKYPPAVKSETKIDAEVEAPAAAKVEAPPEAKIDAPTDSKIDAKGIAEREERVDTNDDNQQEHKTEAAKKSMTDVPQKPKPGAQRDIEIGDRFGGTGNMATLMNMTLGDLLLSSLLKDPENAGRVFAQAIIQASAPAKASKTRNNSSAPH